MNAGKFKNLKFFEISLVVMMISTQLYTKRVIKTSSLTVDKDNPASKFENTVHTFQELMMITVNALIPYIKQLKENLCKYYYQNTTMDAKHFRVIVVFSLFNGTSLTGIHFYNNVTRKVFCCPRCFLFLILNALGMYYSTASPPFLLGSK